VTWVAESSAEGLVVLLAKIEAKIPQMRNPAWKPGFGERQIDGLPLFFIFVNRPFSVGEDLFRNQLRDDIVMIHLHAVAPLALRH
jgi:hypothetical protein